MKGWIMVEPSGVRTAPAVQEWVQAGVAYVSSLPPK